MFTYDAIIKQNTELFQKHTHFKPITFEINN